VKANYYRYHLLIDVNSFAVGIIDTDYLGSGLVYFVAENLVLPAVEGQ
jgi:hypothetical protein